MRYVSTRGKAPVLSFEDALLAGLASDGGLYVPESCPRFENAELESFIKRAYADVACDTIYPFVEGEIEKTDLRKLMFDTYKGFRHEDVAPLRKLADDFWVLELFHGPTLAFKDFALQFLGRMFDRVLAERKQKVTIVGATSGDTGSAAIEACRDRENIEIVILHPKGRVSDVQRRQMTTVDSSNVHNIAIEGSFDDCQDLVKAMFADAAFRKDMNLSAINSINWARIVAQVAYYMAAGAKVAAITGKKPAFVVPTGNFGNVYAGYVAGSMGLPIEKLVVATNRNDILDRFFKTGIMKQAAVEPSLSPSMDIQVSSNFERLLFELYGRDGAAVGKTMRHFREKGPFTLDEGMMKKARAIFASGHLSDDDTKSVIGRIWREKEYLCDPHTAVGIGVAEEWQRQNPGVPVICLSTAHPAKFPEAVFAASGMRPELPPHMKDIFTKPERCHTLPNDLGQVKGYIGKSVFPLSPLGRGVG